DRAVPAVRRPVELAAAAGLAVFVLDPFQSGLVARRHAPRALRAVHGERDRLEPGERDARRRGPVRSGGRPAAVDGRRGREGARLRRSGRGCAERVAGGCVSGRGAALSRGVGPLRCLFVYHRRYGGMTTMPGIRNRLLVGGPIVALVLALLGWAASRALDPERRALRVEGVGAAASEHGAASSTTVGRDAASGGPTGIGAAAPALPDAVFTDEDVAIFRERMAWARAERLDTLPLGEIVARLGRTFVGTPYVAHTLEVDGPERRVINLRGRGCVTFG